MQRKLPVKELQHGMFVAELDRPWLDTPFLLQGFLVDSDEQIYELRRLCEHVYVDPTRSVGRAYEAAPKVVLTPTDPPELSPRPPQIVIQHAAAPTTPQQEKSSLVEDVKTIFKETLSADTKPPASRIDEAPVIMDAYHQGDRERTKLTDTQVSRPVNKNFTLLSVPSNPDNPIIYTAEAKGKEKGFFRQFLDTFKEPISKPVKVSQQATLPASYGEVELTIYEDVVSVEQEAQRAAAAHENSVKVLEDIVGDVRKDKILDVNKVHDAVDGMVESIVRNPDALLWLTRLKNRDNYAYGHAIDVSIYMVAFGRHLGFPKEQLNHLAISGLLQDVGKIKLPQDLLKKKGMLSQEEFELLRAHVGYSMEILSETSGLPMDVFDTVATHHERYDGSGYPRGLTHEQIGMFGAMAGIVDCFQALVTERPYASAISAYQAMQDLHGWRDKFFSGALVEQFIQCLGIFPVGTIVELNTGDIAIVASQNKTRKLKPQVLVVLDPDKKPYSSPTLIDLITDPIAFRNKPYEICRALHPGAYGIDPKEFYL